MQLKSLEKEKSVVEIKMIRIEQKNEKIYLSKRFIKLNNLIKFY